MPAFTARSLHLPLKYTWAISRNSSEFKENIIIRCSDGHSTGLGECAPNVRYGESPALAVQQFEKIRDQILPAEPHEFHLQDALQSVSPALRFGIESAYIHYCAVKEGISVSHILGMPAPRPRPTSYSIPIMPPGELEEFGRVHGLGRFQKLKLKIRNEEGSASVQMLQQLYPGIPLIIDANEGWKDPEALLRFMASLYKSNILFVEQPFPAACTDEYRYLKDRSPLPVWADESVTDHADFDTLKMMFHGINVKLMKAGSYFNAISQLRQARSLGMGCMLGCMVETSLGISSAMLLESLADHLDLDGFMILQDEPFRLVKLEDNGVLRI